MTEPRSHISSLLVGGRVSAESGNVFVFREDGKTLVHEGDISIPHAHTVCIDPNTHLVYFSLENIDGHPLLRIMEPTTTQ